MSLSILAFFIVLIAWLFAVQRDLRRELHEIHANVFVPSFRRLRAAWVRIASVRFGIRHLLVLTTTGAVFLALTRYLGVWVVVPLPTILFIVVKMHQRNSKSQRFRYTLAEVVVLTVISLMFISLCKTGPR